MIKIFKIVSRRSSSYISAGATAHWWTEQLSRSQRSSVRSTNITHSTAVLTTMRHTVFITHTRTHTATDLDHDVTGSKRQPGRRWRRLLSKALHYLFTPFYTRLGDQEESWIFHFLFLFPALTVTTRWHFNEDEFAPTAPVEIIVSP